MNPDDELNISLPMSQLDYAQREAEVRTASISPIRFQQGYTREELQVMNEQLRQDITKLQDTVDELRVLVKKYATIIKLLV